MSDEPRIELDPFEHVWCAVHGEPFRAQYPKGIGVGTMKMFETVTELDEVWERARELTGEDEPDASVIPQVLVEKRACCRVGADTLKRVYRQSGIGINGVCGFCNLFKLGTRYEIKAAGAAKKELPHVCFDCVVERFQPAEEAE